MGQTPTPQAWQAARLVEKISKGIPPAAIPLEVNSTLELVINLKVARGSWIHDRAAGVVPGGSTDPLMLTECPYKQEVHASRQE